MKIILDRTNEGEYAMKARNERYPGKFSIDRRLVIVSVAIAVLLAVLMPAIEAEAQAQGGPPSLASSPTVFYNAEGASQASPHSNVRFIVKVNDSNGKPMTSLQQLTGIGYNLVFEVKRNNTGSFVQVHSGDPSVAWVRSTDRQDVGPHGFVSQNWPTQAAGTHKVRVCLEHPSKPRVCSGHAGQPASTTFQVATPRTDRLWTDGTALFKDGSLFVSRGLVFQHTLTSPMMRAACLGGSGAPANNGNFRNWNEVEWSEAEQRICGRHVAAEIGFERRGLHPARGV